VDQGIEISKTGTAFVSTSAWAGHARAENACTAKFTRIPDAANTYWSLEAIHKQYLKNPGPLVPK
jgi:hypothetical protein